MILNLSYKDQKNVGDANCAPCQYFDIGGVHEDIMTTKHDSAKTVIIGGGAITDRAYQYKHSRKIAWGVGDTKRYMYGKENISHNTNGFLLYGSRDYGHGEFVPCVSCMSPLFDKKYEIKKDVVFYGHQTFNTFGDMRNDHMNLDEVIAYIASGATVVTSSYHGMYWGFLLGRNVVSVPFGSKFFGLPWEVRNVEKYNGEKGLSYPNALAECREANLSFWNKVKKVI